MLRVRAGGDAVFNGPTDSGVIIRTAGNVGEGVRTGNGGEDARERRVGLLLGILRLGRDGQGDGDEMHRAIFGMYVERIGVRAGLHACGLRRVEFRGISLPLPRTNRKITDNGWYGSDHPSTATVEWGTEMLNTTADFLVDYMRAFEKIPLDAE